MKFSIYQFNLSREAADRINEVGFDGDLGKYAQDVKIQRDVNFFGSESWEPKMASRYNLVARCEADNLSEVFHIGNGYGDQSKIDRVERMRSVSVGDLVEDVETGELFMCDPEGWTPVNYMGLQAPHQFGEVA